MSDEEHTLILKRDRLLAELSEVRTRLAEIKRSKRKRGRGGHNKLSRETMLAVWRARESGMTWNEVAAFHGTSKSQVVRIVERVKHMRGGR